MAAEAKGLQYVVLWSYVHIMARRPTHMHAQSCSQKQMYGSVLILPHSTLPLEENVSHNDEQFWTSHPSISTPGIRILSPGSSVWENVCLEVSYWTQEMPLCHY